MTQSNAIFLSLHLNVKSIVVIPLSRRSEFLLVLILVVVSVSSICVVYNYCIKTSFFFLSLDFNQVSSVKIEVSSSTKKITEGNHI